MKLNPPASSSDIEVARQIALPHIRMDKDYILLFITMVGTTITPYMQFYLQSAVVDKGVRIEDYGLAKFDVYAGSIMTVFIAFFIVLATGTILHPAGVNVDSAEDAARALEPLAGNFASHLFAVGLLLNAESHASSSFWSPWAENPPMVQTRARTAISSPQPDEHRRGSATVGEWRILHQQ